MTIITLISDWGLNSHYQASVKGNILRQIPDAQIVDITHTLRPYDIMNCSFILKNACLDFPEGTIHIVGVNTEASTKTPHIVVKYKDMFFIGADNGVFSLLLEGQAFEAIELDIMQETDYFTFSSRDVFVKAASMIASGTPLAQLGAPHANLYPMYAFKPVIKDNKIEGKVIFIDDYENVFVNIDQETFRKVGRGRPYTINFRVPGYAIRTLHTSYSDVPEGERLALFGSTGYLEIAMNKGKASSLLGLGLTDPVSVEFE
ncbi:MAG: SAM hydrolase/SAM-dependent halogenase family protein [Bacteroidota bacterium]